MKREKEQRKVELRVGYNEIEVRTRVKEAGGIWKNEKSVWEIGYGEVKKLGLKDRIVSK